MSKVRGRILAFVLTFCMVFTGVGAQNMGQVKAAEEGSGTITNCTIKVGNPLVDLTDGTEVKNGDPLEIQFNWSLSNDDQTSSEFVVDLGEIKGLIITTGTTESPLQQGSVQVGTYYIENNKLHIKLDKTNKFFDENERTGGVRVSGIVQINDADLNNNKETTIGIGSYNVNVTVSTSPQSTWVNVSKDLSGGLVTDANGNMFQTFTAKITAYNNDAKNIKLTDTPGSGMSFPDNTQITVGGDGATGLATTYNGMTALNAALAGVTLAKDKSIELTYTLPVNNTVYEQGAGYNVKNNTLRVDYTNDKDEPTYNTASTEIRVTDVPSIDKSGEISADQKTVKWKIIVDLGKYYVEGKSFADMVESVVDTPGAGFTSTAIENLPLGEFSHHENGVFQYEYTTTVSDAYLNSGSNATLMNNVELKLKDTPNVYTDSATVDLVGKSWISKSVQATKDAQGYIVWDVVITPPADVTDVKVTDNLITANELAFVEGIWINDEMVRTTMGQAYNGGGTYTALASKYLCQSGGGALNAGDPAYSIDLYFKDDFISQNAGNDIKITYKTKIVGDWTSEFKNAATVTYVCPVIGTTTQTSNEAVFVDDTSVLALNKKVVGYIAPYSVQYRVIVDYKKYNELAVGKSFTVTDVLPAGMTWDSSICSVKAGYGENVWTNVPYTVVDSEKTTDGRQKVVFTLTIDENVYDTLTNNNGSPSIVIDFVASLADKTEIQKLYEAGTKKYVNEADVTDGTIGADASVEAELTAPSVVDKNGKYDSTTAPNCDYSITINKECLDLVEGDTLMGVDTLGDWMTYNSGTVKVEKETASGWVELVQGTEYYFTYSEENGEKKMTFRNLPDATHLRISYKARLELMDGDFPNGAGGNTFTLQGIKNSSLGEGYSLMTTAVRSSGWADADVYSIGLNKYWTDGNGQMHNLKGAIFKVVEVNVDANGMLVDGTVKYDNIEVGDDGTTSISNLTKHKIYALYETDAPQGYERITEPYYFVLQDSVADLSDVDSSIKVHRFTDNSTIWYENKQATGSLKLQKTIVGIDAADIDTSKISFTISPKVGNKDTYSLSEFAVSNGTYSMNFENVPVGEYTITENRTDITGYSFQTVQYTVDGSNPVDGNVAAVDVEKADSVNDATVVAYTNTYTKELVTVAGSKTWVGDTNNSGTRPASITVHLWADGISKDSMTVTAADNWAWSFAGLEKYENGREIVYTITEETVNDYTTEVDGYNITNTYDPGYTSVTVVKLWNDNNNQDGKRPASITVQLYDAAGNPVQGTEKILNAGNQWTCTWVVEDNVTYTVDEVTVPEGYTKGNTAPVSFVSGRATITNTHTPETTSVTGTKTWEDGNNQDGKRPSSITVNLLANGTQIDSKTVKANDNWSWTFDGLDKYDNGAEIIYTITETAVADYQTTINGYNITNTYTPGKTSVSVNKVWDDGNNRDGKRPNSVQVQLLANGVAYGDMITLSPANQWSHTWSNLAQKQDGQDIVYTVEEVTVVSGYEAPVITGDAKDGFTITNTYTPETVNITGRKTWNDANDQDGKRPDSLTVRLLANGTEVDSQTVDASGEWKWTFNNLPKYENGEKITYTITEDVLADYTSKVNGYDITNSYTPGKTTVTVTKSWEDANNQDGIRPEKVLVGLYADGVTTGKDVELSDANQWTYTWTDLDLMANGKTIAYTVKEEIVPAGYASNVTGDVTTGYVIKNTHTPAKVTVNGSKTWVGDDDSLAMRPASITIRLLADGAQVAVKQVTAADNWAWEFAGLNKFANGQEIVYTITEDAVAGYTGAVNGYNVTNTYNSVTPDEPTTPEDPIVPGEPPTTPDEPTKPSEPTTPDEPTKPSEPTKPNEPTKPDDGGSSGGTTGGTSGGSSTGGSTSGSTSGGTTSGGTTTGGSTITGGSYDTMPKTADEAPIGLWVAMMLFGLCGMCTVGYCIVKRRERR